MEPAPAHPAGGPPAAAARTSGTEVVAVFVGLTALTALEIAVSRASAMGRGAVVVALVGLAATKGALIALFFMHLRYETRILKLTVLVPLAAPALYAVALLADTAWRLLR